MLQYQDVLAHVRALPLRAGEYWVTAGAALVLLGLRGQTRDIDMGCTHAQFETLLQAGYLCKEKPQGGRMIDAEPFEIYEEWAKDDTCTVDGITIHTPESLLRLKLRLGREKDQKDIAALRAYLQAGEKP